MKKNQIITSFVLVSALAVSPALAVDLPVSTSASLNASVRANANSKSTSGSAEVKVDGQAQAFTKAKTRAQQEIDRRIASLNKLSTKIDSMKKVSDDKKQELQSQIDTQLSVLSDLSVKIKSEDNADDLKTDINSINKNHQIYMLVVPKGGIATVADQINATADMMILIGNKFQTRIDEAKANNKDVASLQTALDNYRAKVKDAKVQASAATSVVINLNPDNGNKTVIDQNHQTLVDAKAKIKLAQSDLKDARTLAHQILSQLKGDKVEVKSNTSVSSDDKKTEEESDTSLSSEN